MGFFNYCFNFVTLCVLSDFIDASNLDRYHKTHLHFLCLCCLISNFVMLWKYEDLKP